MSTSDLKWCRDRVLVPGNPLTASLPFAPPDQKDTILVLRALVGELASIPGTVSDPDVAAQKLAWWRQALDQPQAQMHPVLKAAVTVGLPQRLDSEAWNGLIQGVRASLEPRRFERFEELWEHCRNIGGAAAMLEFQLLEVPSWQATEAESLRFSTPVERSEDVVPARGSIPIFSSTEQIASELGASGYLTRVVRDLALDARQNRWLLSLDLQAEFQIDRQQVASGVNSRSWRALVLELLVRAHRHRGAALAELDPGCAWNHRHLLISAALDARLGRILARRPGRVLKQRILPGSLGNLAAAWREAWRIRRLARPA